jgi:hypothetical protein
MPFNSFIHDDGGRAGVIEDGFDLKKRSTDFLSWSSQCQRPLT